MLIATFTPPPTETEIPVEIPTQIPTLQPNTITLNELTTTPEDTAIPQDTQVPEDTFTPEDTSIPQDTQIPEDTIAPEATSIPQSTETYPAALIVSLDISINFPPPTCPATVPVTFNGSITTNNETDINYKWLLSGDASNTGTIVRTHITTAGTKDVKISYKLKCGKYMIYLQVIYPNFVTDKIGFTIP